MNCAIFIVTYNKHFEYLKYCLRSIAKFAKGFSPVLLVPGYDFEEAVKMVRADCPDCSVRCGQEWVDKGFLWHESQIIHSPVWCPKANLILHIDADCVFTEPVAIDDYLVNGKPVLMHASFTWLVTQQSNLLNWKVAAENALGFEVTEECMRRHPAVHYPKTYHKTKQCIEECHKRSMDDYIRDQKNTFPQSFAEFPTLGAVAWKFFHDDYHWINQEKEEFPKTKLHQAWSHRTPTNEDIELYKNIGIA